MWEILTRAFDPSGFPARWHCGEWSSELGWLHVVSDLAVWGAYVAIPIVLSYFVLRRRRDLPFPAIFWLFALFIFACGTTHLIEAIIFWRPIYRFAGIVKFVTAVVSWGTVAALIPITPTVLSLRSPKELEIEVAERKRAEAALAGTNQQLRRLATEMSAAEYRERRRIALMLHDHFQQILVAAKFSVSHARAGTLDPTSRDAIEQVDQLLGEAIGASRSLTVELCPPILHERGVVPALEWLARHFREKHGLTVEVRSDHGPEPRDPGVRGFLFESVRELLFNVVKHSGTNRARVIVTHHDDQFQVAVEDDGVGCDLSASRTALDDATLGLFSVQQRVELLGGRFTMVSAPGTGCRVVLSAPLDPLGDVGGSADSDSPEPIAHGQSPVPDLGRSRVRVLIVDDHRIVREGLAGLLRTHPDMEVVGQAENGRMAVEMALRLQPDAIVMDVTMPIMDGIDATRSIVRESPNVRIIGLSMHEERDMADAMIKAGATAYMTKGGPPEALLAALRS